MLRMYILVLYVFDMFANFFYLVASTSKLLSLCKSKMRHLLTVFACFQLQQVSLFTFSDP